jgi:filamentous hemagglutinin
LSAEQRLSHRDNYLALDQQAKAIANDWGAGGTYRQIATALVAGASGNVTGGGTQFAQNMFVNYVQQQGSDYIGKLVLNGLKEGSPEHAGLHAILGCAGAAASSQSCSAGALGGSASSVLAGLFNETNPNETSEEREAKRNIIASVVTGIAAMSNPNGAATATNAAIANVDNNWLATQQIVQAYEEMKAATSPIEQLQVAVKWGLTSVRQDALTGSGIVKGFTEGMAGAGLGTLDSAAILMRDPVGSIVAMKEFVTSPEAIKLLGATAAAALGSQIDQMGEALQKGGDANAENLGNQFGQTVALVVAMVAGGGTNAAKDALLLSRMGLDISSATLKKVAQSAKAGGIEAKLAKLERVGADPDVPQVPELGAKATAGASVDGAGGIAVAPKTIPYEPKGSVVLQGGAPVCGPACAAMTITDKTGAAISLDNAIGSFVNGVRPTGVNTLELSDVISKAGVKNTVNTTMLPEQLNKALQEGASVIVQVPAGQGKHFIIVDSVKSVDGVSYYMTRDPYVGPRGVQQGLLDGAMSTGVNAIVIGK